MSVETTDHTPVDYGDAPKEQSMDTPICACCGKPGPLVTFSDQDGLYLLLVNNRLVWIHGRCAPKGSTRNLVMLMQLPPQISFIEWLFHDPATERPAV